jgi:Putative DNA-binding domain
MPAVLAYRLSGFAAALLDPKLAVPRHLVGPDGEPTTKRFAVYRNNVVVGLIEALQANFPAVCRIVGKEFFRAMARDYVLAEPPCSPILLDYGASFPDFIAGFESAAPLPYLPDVARIERAWTESYHAPDAAPLFVEALAAIANDCVAEAHFTLHPSLRVVTSRFPALTIWRMNVGDGVPSPVDLDSGGEDTLIVRPQADVEVRAIPPGAAEFLNALADGGKLVDAARSAMGVAPHFDLSASIAALIEAEAFVDYSLAGGARDDALTAAASGSAGNHHGIRNA